MKRPIVYRDFKKEELYQIMELEVTCFPPHQRWDIDRYEEVLQNKDLRWWVAAIGDKVVGSLFCLMQQGKFKEQCWFMGVCVHPSFRRQGIAKELMMIMEDTARIAGSKRIMGECGTRNFGSRAMFEKGGYSTIGIIDGYYHGKEDAIAWDKTFST